MIIKITYNIVAKCLLGGTGQGKGGGEIFVGVPLHSYLFLYTSNKFVKRDYTQPSFPYPPPFVDQPCRRRILTIQPTGRLGFQPSRM